MMMVASNFVMQPVDGFLPSSSKYTSFQGAFTTDSFSFSRMFAQQQQQSKEGRDGASTAGGGGDGKTKKSSGGNKKKTNKMTIADLRNEIMKNPAMLQQDTNKNKRKRSRRSRKRVDNPQQTYVYAAQRAKMKSEQKNIQGSTKVDREDDGDDEDDEPIFQKKNNGIAEAREFGLANAANQHCDALVDDVEPQIMGQIRVSEDSNGSGAYAYVIYKPQGWSILGGGSGAAGGKNKKNPLSSPSSSKSNKPKKQRVKIKSDDGSLEYLEFNEDDILSLLSPEERAEYESNGGSIADISGVAYDFTALDAKEAAETNKAAGLDTDNNGGEATPSSAMSTIPGWNDVMNMSPEEREEADIENEDFDPNDVPDFNEADILALMNEEEKLEYLQDQELEKTKSAKRQRKEVRRNPLLRYQEMKNQEDLDESAKENIKRIEKRLIQNKNTKASFASSGRPSIVSWLKELKAKENTPIRGGKFWAAIAGATDVDDSGLVLLSPKTSTDNLFVDYSEYVAVVGNGEFLAPPKLLKGPDISDSDVDVSIESRVRKGREGDTCQVVRFGIPEHLSTCSNIVGQAQAEFDDGIRGDPAANPLDRRAPRRLIHCHALSVSSLIVDEDIQVECESLPDDISILSDRLNNHKYKLGSFLGRSALRDNPLTNAYREINGAADGFPGWTVDRYGDWILVQHDEKEYKGPLPSIHDGRTAGVYYLPANPDRGAMGSTRYIRPTLLEGKAAPDTIPILENGVTYHVSIDKDLSTGIFLDQRPQRAWLTRNCNEETHVLNCFAHCGAFSIAAATAGASTVSLDLNKKWLDRVEPQLKANGIEFDERHDCIYGDCKYISQGWIRWWCCFYILTHILTLRAIFRFCLARETIKARREVRYCYFGPAKF